MIGGYEEVIAEGAGGEQAPDSADIFRCTEKEIKQFFKSLGNRFQRKKQRGSRRDGRGKSGSAALIARGEEFSASSVIDVATADDDRVLHLEHEAFRIRTLRSDIAPAGLYIVSQALTVPQQLHWASTCLSSYSTAEHTNLTNLRNLRRTEGGSPDRDFGEDSSVWTNAIAEDNGLQSFKALRW
jgi:hypothetical protein